MKTRSLLALVSLSVVACGGQVNGPAVEGDGSGSGSSEGSGLGSEGSGYASSGNSGYGGSGYGTGTGYETGSGYGYGSTGYASGSGGYSTGYGTGYGSGSGSDNCGDLPPSGIACGLPAGCTGGLVCEGNSWTCEIFSCQVVGQCAGDAPYCVDGCGNYESSYCDGDGNWACPPTPPCIALDAGAPDTGIWGGGEDAGTVIGVPLPP
jgi:hypothetical protein